MPLTRIFPIALLVGCLVQFPALAAAPDVRAAFDAANRQYEEGNFTQAADGYQKLLQLGYRNATLYFNLGNAFFKSGQMGRAIGAYLQAEQLAPRDPDLRANLKFARDRVQGPSLRRSGWQAWVGRLSLNEWTTLAGLAVWVLFLLLALAQFKPHIGRRIRGWTITSAVAALLLSGGVAISYAKNQSSHLAIVVVPNAEGRQGPLDESKTAVTLHDGAELSILDQRDDWFQVTAGPARIAWVKKAQIVVL